jgi:methyltransferase (TIGR00027 family)
MYSEHSFFQRFKEDRALEYLGDANRTKIEAFLKPLTPANRRGEREEEAYWVNRVLAPIPVFRRGLTEELLQRFQSAHERVQYVILGAGMDTFSLGLSRHDTEVFEVDLPAVIEKKHARLEGLGGIKDGKIRFVGVDFARDSLEERLADAGFDRTVPAFVSLLGVSYYLNRASLMTTVKALAHLADAPTELIFDYPEAGFRRFPHASVSLFDKLAASLGEQMGEGFLSEAMEEDLRGAGFRVLSHLTAQDVARMLLGDASVFAGVRFIRAEKVSQN